MENDKMKDILSEIVSHKRIEVEQQKQAISPEMLQEQVLRLQEEAASTPRSMKQALAAAPLGIIAEFKRRSPSKGWIHREAQPEAIAPAYEAAGAAALSVLTDEAYFGGTLGDIRRIRPLVQLPILRKEFIIDPYQLLQARAVGADAVLLIAACLTPEACSQLVEKAHEWQLEVLLEIHSEEELRYTACGADMMGVNNRHLGSFVTDVATSFQLASALRQAVPASAEAPLLVSESGLSQPETLLKLQEAGYRGFLMGEAFMKHTHPGDALKQLLDSAGKEEL